MFVHPHDSLPSQNSIPQNQDKLKPTFVYCVNQKCKQGFKEECYVKLISE